MISCISILSTSPPSFWSKSYICGFAKQLHLQSGQICHWLCRPPWVFWLYLSDSAHGPCTHHSLFLASQALSFSSAPLPDGRLLSYIYFWCFQWQRTPEWQSTNRELILLETNKQTALFLSILLHVWCLHFLFTNSPYFPHEHYICCNCTRWWFRAQVVCNMCPHDIHTYSFLLT